MDYRVRVLSNLVNLHAKKLASELTLTKGNRTGNLEPWTLWQTFYSSRGYCTFFGDVKADYLVLQKPTHKPRLGQVILEFYKSLQISQVIIDYCELLAVWKDTQTLNPVVWNTERSRMRLNSKSLQIKY